MECTGGGGGGCGGPMVTSTCKRCGGEIRQVGGLTLYYEGEPGDLTRAFPYHAHCWNDKQAVDREIELVGIKGELAEANRKLADLQK